jgi:hypothetical protein
MSDSCPLTPTHAAPLQTEGAHPSPREAHSLPANQALAHAHRAHHHAHNRSHHKLTARQKTAMEQATLAATHAAAARDATRTLIPASAHATDHPVARETDPRRSPSAHHAACSPKLHEPGEHAMFRLHTRRRTAQLHGLVPCKLCPRLRSARLPPPAACERKQQCAAAKRAQRLSLPQSTMLTKPSNEAPRASPSGATPRLTDGGPQGFVSNTNISPAISPAIPPTISPTYHRPPTPDAYPTRDSHFRLLHVKTRMLLNHNRP